MAVDLCSEPSSGISPRISFSHDFCLSEFVSLDQQQQQQQQPPPPFRSASPGSSIDFDFCVRKSSFDQDSSSAAELFSDGKILPTQIKTKSAARPPPSLPSPIEAEVSSTNKRGGEKEEEEEDRHRNCKESSNCNHSNNNLGSDEEAKQQQSSSSRSFWRFKRSSSVNCGTGYGRTLCPLPLLSRSNSTGSSSTASVKRGPDHAGKHQKQHPGAGTTRLSSDHHKKPPLRKSSNNNGGYGNGGAGVRVSPVINVASGNMFGLGSIFFGSNNNKDKSKSKK